MHMKMQAMLALTQHVCCCYSEVWMDRRPGYSSIGHTLRLMAHGRTAAARLAPGPRHVSMCESGPRESRRSHQE